MGRSILKESNQKRKKQTERDCPEETTHVTQITSDLSSSGETARIARAAYPKGNVYMQMRDVLGSIYTDEDFADLFPKEGQPAQAPWRLALVTVMQFVENRTSRQAADAVRGRIDWKYLLGLELTDAGFDASVLSEFRARLIDQQAEELLLEKMLTLFQQKGWRNRTRTTAHR